MTKTLTAAGILLLQEQKKLTITDMLDRYLPDFAPAKQIRLFHLLGHQSGLDNPDYEAIAARNTPPDALLDMIAVKPFLLEPGSASRYSNAGYITLARVMAGGQVHSRRGRRVPAPPAPGSVLALRQRQLLQHSRRP